MKVKKSNEVSLTASTPFSIVLNDGAKGGDTVARELVINADGVISIANSYGTQKVINASTLKVEEYSAGWAIIPCEGLDAVEITASEDCSLFYQILV